MKKRIVNEGRHGEWKFPDSIADWDAPSCWERNRLASMEAHLRQGMVLFDVGVEMGWLSAIYGSWCGHENMVLIEPGDSFWISIRKIWEANNLKDPIACWKGFAGAKANGIGALMPLEGTADINEPEPDPMAYKTLGRDAEIPVITIDQLCDALKVEPDAITIDVEGAEFEVLKGATNAISLYRPLVWVSLHEDLMVPFHTSTAQVNAHMRYLGYHPLDLGIDHEHHMLYAP